MIVGNPILIGGSSGSVWPQMGTNPTKIYTSGVTKVYFKDTEWMNWSPTTTDTTLSASTSYETVPINVRTNDHVFHISAAVYHFYDSLAPTSSMVIKSVYDYWAGIARYASTYANMVQNTQNAPGANVVAQSLCMEYLDNLGATRLGVSNSYGLYIRAGNLPTFSDTQSDTPDMNIYTPTIAARCNSIYMSTYSAMHVDPDTSYYQILYEVYKVDYGTCPYGVTKGRTQNIFLNGIS